MVTAKSQGLRRCECCLEDIPEERGVAVTHLVGERQVAESGFRCRECHHNYVGGAWPPPDGEHAGG